MALCVYHETTEAVAVCVSCKQEICAKCREYGQDGLCGMCVEMQDARKASMEVSRQTATLRVAAVTMDAARPAPRPVPPTPRAPAKPGMCVGHPNKAATAPCAHCQRKFCPFCLDLYDLCPECRALPHCSRHESLVAQERCTACKLSYCKACLGGTGRCDRCRTLGLVGGEGAAKSARSPTQPLKPQTKGTAKLTTPPAVPPAAETPKPKPAGPARPRPPQKRSPAAYRSPSERGKSPFLAIAAVAGVALIAFLFLNHKPSLSADQQLQALKQEMQDVQQAVDAVYKQQGAYPADQATIMHALAAQGIQVDKLPLPLTLFVNAPANEPLSITYRLVRAGYEIRALDVEGRPFAVDGRDVILSSANPPQ